MHNETVHQVEVALSPLLQSRGFRAVDELNSTDFGDGYKIFASAGLRIRVVSDRMQPFINIGGPDNQSECFDAALVQYLMRGGNILAPQNIVDVVEFINANHDEICNLFAPERISATVTELQTLQVRRAQKMFPGWTVPAK